MSDIFTISILLRDPGIGFGEVHAAAGFGLFEAAAHYTLHNDGANDGGPFAKGDLFTTLSMSSSLNEKWDFSAEVAHYSFDNSSSTQDLDYSYVKLDFTTALELGELTFSVMDHQYF